MDVRTKISQKTAAQRSLDSELYFALTKEDAGLVKNYIQLGADVNLPPSNRRKYPLVHACEVGTKKIVNLLLEHGADPNVNKDYCYDDSAVCEVWNHGKPLVIAVARNSVDITKSLLKAGADPNTKSEEDSTVFMAPLVGYSRLLEDTFTHQTVEIMQLLLKYGADINSVTPSGTSSLRYAAADCNELAVKFLLENGAKFSVLDIKFLVKSAITEKQKKMIALIEDFSLKRSVNQIDAPDTQESRIPLKRVRL